MHVLQESYEDYAEESADDPSWSDEQVSEFFEAFQEHGQDWYKVHFRDHAVSYKLMSVDVSFVLITGVT